MLRRCLALAVLAVAALAALPGAALAYIDAPGIPVRSGATYNQLPVAGTCTIGGVTSDITELRLSLVSAVNYVEATSSGLVFHYALTAVCGQDYVLASLTVPLSYSIDDAAGTLTFTGLTVPASFTGETIDGLVGSASLTSGSGPLGPVVYGADTATERSGVVSRHKSIDRAKTDADRASRITGLIVYLE